MLRKFARDHSQDAFTDLVNRHVNLVHSAALRQLRSPHLAEEVTQSVFNDLARNAVKLSQANAGATVLTAWLYQVARRTAIDVIRKESRRRQREQIALEMNDMNADDDEWKRIEPLLDDAMAALEENDRTAILLRFFENKNLREVGESLNISDDAAQKRVSRALERLREFFTKRKVKVGTSGLAVLIAAKAVQSAPIGLAATISAAALLGGAAVSSSTVITTTKIIAMTTLQKTFVAATFAILAGAGIYKAHQVGQLREQNQTLRQQQAVLTGQNTRLAMERDEALARVESTKSAPHLPAPHISAAATPAQTNPESSQATNLVRLLNGEPLPKLTAEQIAAYLKENHTNAASLLAVFRATGDKSFLSEAEQAFPGNPQVAFESVFNSSSPAELRQNLENFERLAPDNALANYLSAQAYFGCGQTDQAVQELTTASNKPGFDDYSWDFIQTDEEALRSAGYPEAEVKMAATWQIPLPQVPDLNQLSQNIIALANAYQQTGDQASAQAALQYDIQLGEQLDRSPDDLLINQINGMAIQRAALGTMDPYSPYGTAGRTVADQIAEFNQQDAAIKALVQQMTSLQQMMSAQDWITYNDRTMAFGEMNALQWLIDKYARE
ncbi:MAG: sigma-70 family RNA polymerase sigma factor [Verrucomicrobiota bacterium]